MKKIMFLVLCAMFLNGCTIGNSYLNIENGDSLFIVLHRERSSRANIMFKYTLEYWQESPNGFSFKKNVIYHTSRDWEVGELVEMGSAHQRANNNVTYYEKTNKRK